MRGLLIVALASGVATADDAVPVDKSFAPPSAVQPLAEPAQPDHGPTEIVHTSYRNVTLTADGISVGLVLAIYADRDDRGDGFLAPAFVIGMLGAGLATPIIHGIHGHGGRGIASFLIRSGLLMAGATVAVNSAHCDGSEELFCGVDRIPAGLAVGTALAAWLDAALLTDETHEIPIRDRHAWTPIVQPQHGGASFGVAARF